MKITKSQLKQLIKEEIQNDKKLNDLLDRIRSEKK